MTIFWDGYSTSKTPVILYETTRRYIPEGYHLHTRRRENLKSHVIVVHFLKWLNWIFCKFSYPSGLYVTLPKLQGEYLCN